MVAQPSQRLSFRLATVVVSVLVSGVFAYFALRDIEWADTWDAIRGMEYWWLAPALASLTVWTAIRAVRWQNLFRADRRPPLLRLVEATVLGLFFNNILPARAGEAARVLFLRTSGVPVPESAATIVVERLFDVLCLFGLLFVLLPWLPPVGWLHAAVWAAVGAAVITAAVAVLAAHLERRSARGVQAPRLLHTLALGLTALRGARQALVATVWTIASWFVLALAFWLVMRGFRLHLSVLAGTLTAIAVGLSFAVPAAPAGVGVFEAAGLAATSAYGISRSVGLAYVLVLHVLTTVPYLVGGLVVLTRRVLRPRSAPATEPSRDGEPFTIGRR
jgi:glycosyltransferase 2 family protein